tara:strand:+ start:88 stop:900 length:813 start_codon:yes stop_codon:yes gene_type:complete
MKTIKHNFNNPKGKQAAANDHSLNCTAFAVFSLISDYIEVNGSMSLTNQEMSSKWSIFSPSTISRSITMLKAGGYLEQSKSQDLFNMTRVLTATGSSDVKPKTKTTDKDLESQFSVLWNLYNHKQDKVNSMKRFAKLSEADRLKAIEVTPLYIASLPGWKSQQLLSAWLNGERFNDEFKPEVHISQKVTPTKAPSASDIAHEKRRAESRAAAKQRKIDRIEEYGWDRPYPSVEDYKMNNSRIQKGGADDVEACLTYRLKRDGLMNKNNKK